MRDRQSNNSPSKKPMHTLQNTKETSSKKIRSYEASLSNLPVKRTMLNWGISVNIEEDKREEKKILAIIDRIAEEKFLGIKVSVCGTLQRHNWWLFINSLDEKEIKEIFDDLPSQINEEQLALFLANKFRKLAEKREEDWIKNWQKTLHRKIKHFSSSDITRWDDWLNHSSYAEYRKQVNTRYKNNPEFKKGIEDTIEKFLMKRHAKAIASVAEKIKQHIPTLKDIDFIELAKHASRNYLLEECAIFAPIWAKEKKYLSFAYRDKKMTPAFAESLKYFLTDEEQKSFCWIPINVRGKKKEAPSLAPSNQCITSHSKLSIFSPSLSRRSQSLTNLPQIPFAEEKENKKTSDNELVMEACCLIFNASPRALYKAIAILKQDESNKNAAADATSKNPLCRSTVF